MEHIRTYRAKCSLQTLGRWMMEIRELRPDEVDVWVELRRALWPDTGPEALRADADRVLSSPDEICFLLVDPARGPVGFLEGAIHPGPEEPHAHLEAWYVVPGLRGRGHGAALLDRFENWCIHRSICNLTSDTDPGYPISPHAHAGCGFRVLTRQTIFIKELQPSSPADRV